MPASCSTRLEKVAVWPSRAASPSQRTKSRRTGGLITHSSSGKADLGQTLPKGSQHRAIGPLQPCPQVTEKLSVPHTPTSPPREHRQPERGSRSSSPISMTPSPSPPLLGTSPCPRAGGKGFLFENEFQLKAKRAGSGTSASRNPRRAAAPSSSRHGEQHGTGSNTGRPPCSSHARRAPPPKPPLPGTAARNAACLQAAVLALSSPAETRRVGPAAEGAPREPLDTGSLREAEKRHARPRWPPAPPRPGSPQPLSALPGPIPVPLPAACRPPRPVPGPAALEPPPRSEPRPPPRPRRNAASGSAARGRPDPSRSALRQRWGGEGRRLHGSRGAIPTSGAIPARGSRWPIKSVHYQSSQRAVIAAEHHYSDLNQK